LRKGTIVESPVLLANSAFPSAKTLTCIKGIHPFIALTLYPSINKDQQFKNARQLAAWLGLAPQQHGTEGLLSWRHSVYKAPPIFDCYWITTRSAVLSIG